MQQMNEITTYFEFVRPSYNNRDAGHDLRHIARIIERLDDLSVGCHPAPTRHLLFFLAAFHGLGEKLQEDSDFRQLTEDFLRQLGWKSDEIPGAFVALQRHLSAPETTEEMIVHDANFFEVTGPFGIAKAFTVGGHFNQTYERTLEIFEENVEKLVFRTPVGRSAYHNRKDYARAFIVELREELKLKRFDENLSLAE
ncbi:hypothetical protein [uncultured Roseovarius sp.]|uniref:hypothetical protein n=1 Tax=uncultured Roseovarius sp. TaxID=293344 RepID=UPI00260CA18E|nr:hypothetical protein [uncultured Roseovarius sp.]